MKVGDRVRCVKDGGYTRWFRVDSEGVVTKLDECVRVQFDTGFVRLPQGEGWYGEYDQFEVIE